MSRKKKHPLGFFSHPTGRGGTMHGGCQALPAALREVRDAYHRLPEEEQRGKTVEGN
jgi:hypothetical protein